MSKNYKDHSVTNVNSSTLFNTSLILSKCGLIEANDAPTDKAQAVKILEIIKKLTESNIRVDL